LEELKLYRPDGTPFHSFNEVNVLLMEEQQRTESQRQQAKIERQRAESEKERADRLEALLNQYRDQFGDLGSPET
jgi:hypothetical protein